MANDRNSRIEELERGVGVEPRFAPTAPPPGQDFGMYTTPPRNESSPIPPRPLDLRRNVDRIVGTLQQLEENEPWLTQTIAGSDRHMAVSQEVAAGLYNEDITNYVISSMMGDEELKPFDEAIHDSALSHRTELVSQFFQDYSGLLNPMEKNFIAYLLTPLKPERRDQLLAVAHEYINANDIQDGDTRATFMVFLAQTAQGKLNEQLGEENTFLGKLGRGVDRLGKPIREFASNIWARTADPTDSTYREHLSIGQNIAITLGQTPGTTGFQIGSGIADGISQFALDPVGWASGVGAGAKVARTFPRLTNAGRLRTLGAAIVPWRGRNVAQLPRFSRGITTRIGWALNSRTVDQMFDAGEAGHKLAQSMYDVAQRGGIAALRENFPIMANSLDGIGDLIAQAENPAQVADILREGLSGGFLNSGARGMEQLKNAFEGAERTYNRQVDTLLADGEIGLGDIGGLDGVDVDAARVFSIGDEVTSLDGAGVTASSIVGDGTLKVTFRGTEKVLDLGNERQVAAFGRWMRDNAQSGNDRVLANRILSGNYQFTDEMVDTLNRYATAAGQDVVQFGDNAIITSNGARKAVVGQDKATDSLEVANMLKGPGSDLINKRQKYQSAAQGNADLWVLNEMPARAPRGFMRKVKGLWRGTASNDSTSWWAQSRRMASARIFNKAAPNTISIDNTSEMVEGFSRLARSFGARKGWIDAKINELAGTKFMDRYDAVRRAIIELSDEVDHPILRHRLQEYVDNQAVREFMPGPGGREMAVAASREDGVTKSAVPLIPSLLRRQVQLPGPDFHRSLMRYRRAQNSDVAFLTRGVTSSTRKKRAQIVAQVRRRLQAKIEANPQLRPAIEPLLADEDRLFSIAYGSVFQEGLGNGVGYLAKAGAGLGKGLYTPIHSVFSVAQLAFRPVSWMLRVNLDEQARGALFDLPSIFRNPARYMQSWWDAYHISKAEKWATANSMWMAQTSTKILQGTPEAAYRNVVELWGRGALDALGEAPNMRRLRNFVNNQLRDIANGTQPLRGLGDQMNMGRWATRRLKARARGMKRTSAIEEKYGLKPQFTWEDAHEIQMKGTHQVLVEEMAGSVAPLDWTPGMTQRGAYDFGTAWASKAGQYARDPVMRAAMKAAARRARSQASVRREARQIVQSRNWHELRQNYTRLARENGWDDVIGDDLALAERVMEEVLIPQVDHVFSPMWNSADDVLTEKARILDDILSSGRSSTFVAHDGIEYTFDFRKGSGARLRSQMHTFTGEEQARQAMGQPGVGMPDRIAAYFDPFYAADDGRRGIPAAWRKFTDWSIGTFGERATQGLNRRPAYLATHRRAFQRFKALGLDDDAARMAAHGEATRLVNYVYYNMDDTVPMLRQMNKVIPFFSAAWEVAQTWAYKIPKELAGGAGFVAGWPRMARTVDRYFDAFINSQLLEVQEDGSYVLRLSQDLGMSEALPVSNYLSKAGNDIANTPFTIIEHLANMANDLRGIDEDVELGSPDIRIRVAAPIDPTGEGVGNALSFHLGLNPLVASLTAKFKDQVYHAIDGKDVVTEGQTFAELQELTGADDAELLRVNKIVIQEAIGKDEYAKLETGATKMEDYVLPEGLKLRIPRSSLVGSLVDDLFFAFDASEFGAGTFYHMQPSWAPYIWRGLGLWAGNDGHPPGFLEFFEGPSGEAMMYSAVTDGIRRLEASEGAVTKLHDKRNTMKAFIDEMEGILVVDVLTGDVTGAEGANPELVAEASEKFQDLWEDVQDQSEYILNRAGDLAGGQLITRGVFGLFLPSNPQSYLQNAHLEDAYYQSKDFLAGEGIPEIRNATDYETFASLMTAWWEDETGDSAKMLLQELYPGMEMWWKGKSYWTEGTVPAEVEDIDDYFRLVGDGSIQMKPPEVFMLDQAHSALSLLKEAEIRQEFGEGAEAVVNILTNYSRYKDLAEEIELGHADLDWFDDLFFEGAYDDYQNRERRTVPRLTEELKLATFDKFKNLDDIAEVVADIADASPDEAADLARQLSTANRESRDLIYELLDLPEYEGVVTERERILELWWNEVDAYYEQVDAIFAPLQDPTLDSDQRNLVFENWRMFQDANHEQPIVIDGIELPNEIERSWSSKTEEEKQRKRLRDISKKPEWLSTVQIAHLEEEYSGITQYMPRDRGIYDALTEFKNETKRLVDAGEISQYQGNKDNAEAEEMLAEQLIEQGRGDEIIWRNATPLERMELLDSVPPMLDGIMPYYRNLVGSMRANDVSLKSTSADAVKAKGAFYDTLVAHLAAVPGGAQQFMDLGLTMFGDDFDAPDEIAAVLFFNDRYNDL